MTPIDKPIRLNATLKRTDLPFAEQFLLWGIRMWAQAFNQGANNYEILDKGFTLAGVRDAHDALDDIMSIFATSGQGVININCPQCECITIDENRIMGAVAAWQKEADPSRGNIYIRSWLPAAALRIMCKPACQLAEILNQGDLNISSRNLANEFQFKDEKFISNHSMVQYIK
jgi:hypothetical protein